MTIAHVGSNTTMKFHNVAKGEKERPNNVNKIRKFFSKSDLRRNTSTTNDETSSTGKLEKKATDGNVLQTTDAATETFFWNGINVPPDNNKTAQAPFSDLQKGAFPNHAICPWCGGEEATANAVIHISNCSFAIHKCSVVSKSGYLKMKLADADEIELPDNFPGGVMTFQLVLDFCKGSTIVMDSSKVASLRCAAEYLEMDGKQCRHNLSNFSEKYLNEVALQSWADTSNVLQNCADLVPLAEKLNLVSRCIDSLAFTACVELLEREEREEIRLYESSESNCWSEMTSSSEPKAASAIWWIADIISLPHMFFGEVIRAFRKQGMSEKYVSLIITKCTENWFFGDWLHLNNSSQTQFYIDSNPMLCSLLENIEQLLPDDKHMLPVGFLFSLLRCAILLETSADCRMNLENRLASQLEFATVRDFLMPSASSSSTYSKLNLDSLVRVFSKFASQNDVPSMDSLSSQEVSAVTKVWDEYIGHIGTDHTIDARKFADLVEVMPGHLRINHDHLYKTISIYLKTHPYISQEERLLVCRSLVCQKLSQEACIDAVQNEFMPLRMIVQAMFVQHIQTRRVLNEQLRMVHAINPESLPPSGQIVSIQRRTKSRFSKKDPFSLEYSGEVASDFERELFGRSPETHVAHLQTKIFKSDLEETNDRLHCLERELAELRLSLSEAYLRNGHCAQQTSTISTHLHHGLEAASSLFNSRSKRGLSFRQARMDTSHRSIKVGQKLVRSIFQKMGIGALCKSRNENGCGVPKMKIINERSSEAGEEAQSHSDKIFRWDDGMAFHPSMELKARKQGGNHSRHHSFA